MDHVATVLQCVCVLSFTACFHMLFLWICGQYTVHTCSTLFIFKDKYSCMSSHHWNEDPWVCPRSCPIHMPDGKSRWPKHTGHLLPNIMWWGESRNWPSFRPTAQRNLFVRLILHTFKVYQDFRSWNPTAAEREKHSCSLYIVSYIVYQTKSYWHLASM